jgi:hypothetical protein
MCTCCVCSARGGACFFSTRRRIWSCSLEKVVGKQGLLKASLQSQVNKTKFGDSQMIFKAQMALRPGIYAKKPERTSWYK